MVDCGWGVRTVSKLNIQPNSVCDKCRMMVTFCTFGVVQSFGVYQDYYTVSSYSSLWLRHCADFIQRISLKQETPSTISWIGSVQVFFVFAIGLPAGRLFDAGYFHHCLIGGSVLYIFS